MRRSLLLLAALTAASTMACSSSDEYEPDPAQFTVSHRNQVRLPGDGTAMTAETFAGQVKKRDPIAKVRCAADASQAYKDATTFLGGVAWSHPVPALIDQSLPTLWDRELPPIDDDAVAFSGDAAPSGNAASAGPAPTIERPDLVGVQNGVAVFLSKTHGLVAVDAKTGALRPSCSMKVPGEPKNFLFHGDELVVVSNARGGHNRAALLRYAIEGGAFRFVDALTLEGQTIQDARLFDSTIVLYTQWSKTRPAPAIPDPAPPAATTTPYYAGPSGGVASSDMAGAPAPGNYGRSPQDLLGTKVLVVQWDDKLGVDWQDSLLNDPEGEQDPLAGKPAPVNGQYEKDQLVAQSRRYHDFVSASDRYLAVPHDVQSTRFDHWEHHTYQVCTNYNPKWQEVEVCNVNYEQRPNPDYKAPNPATGNYDCGGKALADCVHDAAPQVSQYIYVPTGQTCQMVWQGRCEKYETRTDTYPAFRIDKETQLTVYRFENGGFTKLDSSLAKMSAKADGLSFTKEPLGVKGSIVNRNQIQMQNGHLYAFANDSLQTLSIAGNSIAFLDALPISADTESSPAIAFSSDRAMISSSRGTSQVTMVDLSVASKPRVKSSFWMPGQSTQLLLAGGGILGPGQVQFSNERVYRSIQKVTLFSRDDGRELDNVLLGTDYDAFESSWLDANDDQRIRLDRTGTRLFVPYSGRHHADTTEPTAHRLGITRIEGGRLVSERSFAVADDIVRTTSIDDARALVFGNSGTYVIDRASGDWKLDTLREILTPIATYRIVDAEDVHARVSRVGTKCVISTHGGDANALGGDALAEATIPCPDTSSPIGYADTVVFAETLTGVRFGKDGKSVTPLAADEVKAITAKVGAGDIYCRVDGYPQTAPYASMIVYLDGVPGRVVCGKRKHVGGGVFGKIF